MDGGIDRLGPLGLDPLDLLACGNCGWSGSAAPAVADGPTGEVPGPACPSCHEQLSPGMPPIDEIRAARRAPADGPRER